MTTIGEVYISVDIEASGPIPGEYSMLSLGACLIEDTAVGFYREIAPITDKFVPKAMEVTGFDLESLKLSGTSPGAAMEDFAQWIAEHVGNDQKSVFVGFNAPFDWSFVNYYFHRFSSANPFGIGGIDIKALYMGATGCTWSETRSSLFPVAKQPSSDKHNALADAIYQADLFKFVRSLGS
jgi:DNA polymerase III alpha subunit (gram-positive type)